MSKMWTRPMTALTSLLLVGAVVAPAAGAEAAVETPGSPGSATFTATVFATGADLVHSTPSGKEALTQPDDITRLGHTCLLASRTVRVLRARPAPPETSTAPSSSSTSEATRSANGTWSASATGSPRTRYNGQLIATVNEDANSSVYLINPVAGAAPVDYRYSEPLPSKGGTDAISVFRGMILISASAPGTTGVAAPQATYPAVYRVAFDAETHVAHVFPLFFDEAEATVANVESPSYGQDVRLALIDPDSNEDVPYFAPRLRRRLRAHQPR